MSSYSWILVFLMQSRTLALSIMVDVAISVSQLLAEIAFAHVRTREMDARWSHQMARTALEVSRRRHCVQCDCLLLIPGILAQ